MTPNLSIQFQSYHKVNSIEITVPNYWGYDVLVVDIDALLNNNIQPIFDHFIDLCLLQILRTVVHQLL